MSEITAPASVGGAVSNRSGSELIEDHEMMPVRDAGGGKARGPNGRYLPRDNPSPVPKSSRKSFRKSQIQNLKPESPAPTEDDNIFAAVPSSLLSEKEQAQSPSAPGEAQSLSGQAEAENTNGMYPN
jgi:hypothetical protein